MSARDFRNRGGVGVLDIVGALVLGEVGFCGGTLPSSRVILCGTSYFVADETFIVSDVFCLLDWGKVDLIYIHGHGIFGVFLRSRERDIVGSPS